MVDINVDPAAWLRNIGIAAMSIIAFLVMMPLFTNVLNTVLSNRSRVKQLGENDTTKPANILEIIAGSFRKVHRACLSDGLVLILTAAMPICAIWMHWSRMILHSATLDILGLHALPSVWINASMLYHLYRAATEPAGNPIIRTKKRDEVQPEKLSSKTEGIIRMCAACDKRMEPNMYHCRQCRRCTAEMDHHCPFTANCVGRNNYKFFFGFVLWGWLATVYAVWLTANPGYYCHLDEFKFSPTCSNPDVVTLLQISKASLTVLTILMSLVIVLLVRGQTFRGFLTNKPPALDTGNGAIANVERRLGPKRSWWRLFAPGCM